MTIMVGIDMHVKTLVCEIGHGKKAPKKKTFTNETIGHYRLMDYIDEQKQIHNASDVLVAYEASGLGYVLYDKFNEKGYSCAILAPTELKRSATGFKKKRDKKDAHDIYETVRGHVLAGNQLHDVWVPDKNLRAERDVVRSLHDLSEKITQVKNQVQTLLKKYGIRRPEKIDSWTKAFMFWLEDIGKKQSKEFRICLHSFLRQISFLTDEKKYIEKEVKAIADKPKFKKVYEKLMEVPGVGVRTAMTFLTEIGDVTRFNNRREIGSYMGLTPSTNESGDADDRKGRITRSGPYRLRSILNQAVWIHLRFCGEEKVAYDRIATRNPKHKKKAVVACMRRLGIKLWHIACDVIKEKNLEEEKTA